MIDPGPYLGGWGDGPEVYFPVSLWPWPKAQHEAAVVARDQLGSIGRAAYRGKSEILCHQGDEHSGDPDDAPLDAEDRSGETCRANGCRRETCYFFEVDER